MGLGEGLRKGDGGWEGAGLGKGWGWGRCGGEFSSPPPSSTPLPAAPEQVPWGVPESNQHRAGACFCLAWDSRGTFQNSRLVSEG